HPAPSLVTAAQPVRVLAREVPTLMAARSSGVARFVVENASDTIWLAPQYVRTPRQALAMVATIDGRVAGRMPLRTNVSPGQRSTLVVELRAPVRAGSYA